MAFGMPRRSPSEPDLLVLGEIGIGNTTAAAAIYHALYGGQAEDWVGRGTGVDDEGLRRKADAVRAAVAASSALPRRSAPGSGAPRRARNRSDRRCDNRCAHAPHAGAARRLRGVLGGGGTAGPRQFRSRPCLAAHISAERAHRHALKLIGKTPLFDFGMRLGEGSGAALAVRIVEPRSPATTAWRHFGKRAWLGRKSLERR